MQISKKNLILKVKLITVARPFIRFKKRINLYCKKVFNFYVNDPSNEMEKFQRVRLRKLISNLKDQGLDFNKLNLTIK